MQLTQQCATANAIVGQ